MMIEKILALAKQKVDEAEVFFTESSTAEVTFEAGMLKSIEEKNTLGFGLRVINNGRIGFSSSSDPGRIDELVEQASASSQFGKEVQFTFPGAAAMRKIATFDSAVENFSSRQAIEEGTRTVDLLREECPKGLTNVYFSSSVSNVRIANTSGLDVSHRSTNFDHMILLMVVDGDSILWIPDGGHFGTLDIRTDKYVKKIVDLHQKAETNAPRISGSLPVIFTAEEMPNLLESIEIGINGKRLLKGDSPLINREGEQVLGAVTLTDNPSLDCAPGSCPFDDEGVPSQVNVIFENGLFRTFLFDLDTASKTDRESTASASRSALSIPDIDTSNLIMSPGTSNLDNMIADMDEGIIVYGVLGGGQSNLLAGDFALNITLGFLVRRGEIVGRLLDTMVSGNVYRAFGDISALGDEAKPVGTTFAPDVMFSELSISGR